MNNKINKITKLIPVTAFLPDGEYEGIWGGYTICVKHEREIYELKTEIGIKGIGHKVKVNIENGVPTFKQEI